MSEDLFGKSKELLALEEKPFTRAVGNNDVSWRQESLFAAQALKANNFLCKVAVKDPGSFKHAIINIAAIGISLNPAEKLAYLVPRSNKVCLDISYRGLIHLATTGGAINWAQAKIVYSNDEYINNGVDEKPTHKYPPFSKDRGEIVGVYCVAQTSTGSYLTTEMTIEEVHYIRSLSASYTSSSSPWKNWYPEMVKKTVIKRAAKTWPGKNSTLHKAVEMLNEDEGYNLAKVVSTQEKGEATESETLNKLIEENSTATGDSEEFNLKLKSATTLKDLIGVGRELNLSTFRDDVELQKLFYKRKEELMNG